MQKCSQNETIEHKNSKHCVVSEFPMADHDINFAIVNLSARYPDVGLAKNTICKELVYVEEGSGKIVVEGVEYPLEKGDTILIQNNEKYYWEGDLKLHISCTPAFMPEQHVYLDE